MGKCTEKDIGIHKFAPTGQIPISMDLDKERGQEENLSTSPYTIVTVQIWSP